MKAIRSPLAGAGPGMTAGVVGVGVTIREGEGDGVGSGVEADEDFGEGEADTVSVIVRSGVPVGDAISAVGDPTGRASVGDIAGTVSAVQAVRISNRDRMLAPARRMFPRERRAFKIAESDKNNLMAATLIADYDYSKAMEVP